MAETPEQKLRNLSDTAFWVAQYRAEETSRSDALFKDPLAAKLLEHRGKSIKEFMDRKNEISWPIVVRTYLIDSVVQQQVTNGVDTVLYLAAGLDTRPYRLSLPGDLTWIEVDLPELLNYKTDVLRGEVPNCQLQRISTDLTNYDQRDKLFQQVNNQSKKVLVITEGLLIYLAPEAVTELANHLSGYSGFYGWMMDLASPGLIKRLNRKLGDKLEAANAPFKFGPGEGPDFFEPLGWTRVEVHSFLKTAAALKRVNLWMRLLAMLPESQGKQGSKPWSAVCLFRNKKYRGE